MPVLSPRAAPSSQPVRLTVCCTAKGGLGTVADDAVAVGDYPRLVSCGRDSGGACHEHSRSHRSGPDCGGKVELRVLGAAEHNLRNVDVTFGPGLTAVVGVSGKSSLAFDVVYKEARRRFVQTLAFGRGPLLAARRPRKTDPRGRGRSAACSSG
ncbi:hypothetical protein GCM10009872_48510 [Actinopolymorpha rutila]